MRDVDGPNYQATRADILVTHEDGSTELIHPEKRFYPVANFATTEVAIRRTLRGHVYVALGDTIREEPGVWRIGFTKFATRMLGDLVEHGFHAKSGEPIEVGQEIGWVEGFKALTDLYGVIDGEFLGSNPALEQDPTLTDTDCYGKGWLYSARGTPEPNAVDVHGYTQLLDLTIDKMQEKAGEPPEGEGDGANG